MHDIIKASIFAAIGVLVFASLLVPVVSDAMTENGEPITYTNDSTFVLKEAEAGDVLKNIRTTEGGTNSDAWTFNNTPIVGPQSGGTDWTVGIMSDSVYLMINAPANASAGSWLKMDGTGTYHYFGNITVTFTGSEIQIVTDFEDTSGTFTYSWAYVICSYDQGEYVSPALNGSGYVNKSADVLLCGFYSTGDLDCMYSYHKGATYVSNSSYTMSVDNGLTLVDGTTDIYKTAVDVAISDGNDTEHFTPFRIFVPYQVTGHATSGALYDMLGILPIAVICVLIFGVLGAALYSRIE